MQTLLQTVALAAMLANCIMRDPAHFQKLKCLRKISRCYIKWYTSFTKLLKHRGKKKYMRRIIKVKPYHIQ